MILVRGDILMNKEEITNKLNYIDDELVKLQNAKVMKYLCNVESYIDYLQKENCKLNHYKLLYQKVDKLNNVLDEIREYINKNSIYFATKEKVGKYFANCNCADLLKILDEVKE